MGVLAQRLQYIVLAALVGAVEGCLWPPDVSERRSSSENFVIRLDRSKVSPSPDEVVDLTMTRQFRVDQAVTLKDETQRVIYTWYVDYVVDPGLALYPQSGGTLVVNPCAPKFKTLYHFHEGGFHFLEVFASIEGVQTDELTGLRTPPKDYAYIEWYLDLRGVKCP